VSTCLWTPGNADLATEVTDAMQELAHAVSSVLAELPISELLSRDYETLLENTVPGLVRAPRGRPFDFYFGSLGVDAKRGQRGEARPDARRLSEMLLGKIAVPVVYLVIGVDKKRLIDVSIVPAEEMFPWYLGATEAEQIKTARSLVRWHGICKGGSCATVLSRRAHIEQMRWAQIAA
jgi:hypothetical protein